MNVLVQSTSIPITRSLRNFAHRQARKIGKLKHRASKITICLDKVKGKKNDPGSAIVKYVINLPGKVVVVRARAVDLYAAIVEGTGSAMRQVRKFREKKRDMRRQ